MRQDRPPRQPPRPQPQARSAPSAPAAPAKPAGADTRSPPAFRARSRRRIPRFHPVPVAPRADGWTPARQAAFIGLLAQTRSVAAAARCLGMRRESAYRLRRRPGAAGFAAAWDAALGKPYRPIDTGSAKATGLAAHARLESGLAQIVMHAGRYVATVWKADDKALLQHLAQLDRGRLGRAAGAIAAAAYAPAFASTPAPRARPGPAPFDPRRRQGDRPVA